MVGRGLVILVDGIVYVKIRSGKERGIFEKLKKKKEKDLYFGEDRKLGVGGLR